MNSITQRHTYYGGSVSSGNAGTGGAGARAHAFARDSKKRQVTFGPYIIGPTLGEGEFGKVKLGWSKSKQDGGSKNVAIKLVRRDTIPKHSEKEVKIYREINALKRLNHPNIVHLEEVLQNSKYIGIVLQYASGGEFYKHIQRKGRLKESPACKLFAQLISGVHYMHQRGLAHRDLKLENLLLDEHENLIITDFGFVNEFRKSDLMKTSCGSPCYAAPELVVTTKCYEARKADVWSCGVILYAMLAGYLPWDDDPDNPEGDDIAKLYHYITRTALKFPEYINPLPRDLLRRILVSNPEVRINVEQIKQHTWLYNYSQYLSLSPDDWDVNAKAEQGNLLRPPLSKASQSVRPRSNCSTSSTNSKGDKRNSLVMDSTLNPQPIPPQESQSHVITKPTSPRNDMHKKSPVRRHTRSGSAASIALQAVVDAERGRFRHSESTHSLQSETFPQNNTPPTSAGRTSTYAVSRAATNHNGLISSLMNQDSVIVEVSPQKGSIAPIIMPSNREFLHGKLASQAAAKQGINSKAAIMQKPSSNNYLLPQSNRRMRPTSYQPSSSSYTAQSDFSNPQNAFGLSFLKSYRESPLLYTGGSKQRASEKSYPPAKYNKKQDALNDLMSAASSISGDISNTIDRSITIPEENATPGPEQAAMLAKSSEATYRNPSKRHFSIPINNPSLVSQSDIVGSLEARHYKNSAPQDERPLNHPSPKVRDTSDSGQLPASPTSDSSLKFKPGRTNTRDKRFSLVSFYSFYNNSKSSLETSTDHGYHHNSPITESSKHDIFVTSTTSTEDDRGMPLYNTRATKTNTKKHISTSRTVNTASQSRTQRSSMVSPRMKPMTSEESNKTKKKGERRSARLSAIEHQGQHSAPSDVRPRDQSTARKVFDFFKRRSLRL